MIYTKNLEIPSILKKQANIFSDVPLEPIEKSFKRACGHMRTAKPGSIISFYFARGRLHGSTQGVKMHEIRLRLNAKNLVGAYLSDCDIALIREDIEEFYKNV